MSLDKYALPGNILDRILELERQTKWLTDNAAMPIADPESGDGAITYVEILNQLVEGPDIDLVNSGTEIIVGRAGNVLLLFDRDGAVLREYTATDAGLTEALAAAATGDVVWLPAGTITGNHTIPANIEVAGLGYNSVLSGVITNNGTATGIRFSGTLTNNALIRFCATTAVSFILQGTGAALPTAAFPIMMATGSPLGTIPWAIRQNAADDQTPTMIFFQISSGTLGGVATGFRNATGALGFYGHSGKRVQFGANGIDPKDVVAHLVIDVTGRVGIYEDVPVAQFDIQSAASGIVALIARGASGQTADIVQVLNSDDALLCTITKTGAVLIIEQATPDTPAAGYGLIYFKTDGFAYSLNAAGHEVNLGIIDASQLTFTPAVLADWDGGIDPGATNDAMDQLAERVTDNEEEIADLPSLLGGLVFSQVVDVTVADTTDETSILGAGRGSKTLDAEVLDVGSVIVIVLQGHVSDTGTPTLDLKVALGGTEVCSTGAVTLAPTITEEGFTLRAEIVCRTTGAGGTVVAGGTFEYGAGNQHKLIKTAVTAVATDGALAVDVTADWGTDDASNTITSQIATISLIKADNLAVAAPSGLTAVEV